MVDGPVAVVVPDIGAGAQEAADQIEHDRLALRVLHLGLENVQVDLGELGSTWWRRVPPWTRVNRLVHAVIVALRMSRADEHFRSDAFRTC